MEINATLLGQLITFAILVWFMMKYVWPPITKAMYEREKTIADGLEAGERGRRELAAAEQNALTIIQNAKQDAAVILDQAHKRSTQLIDEAKDHAKQEAARIIEHANGEIAREVSQTREALRKQLAALVVAGTEKIIRRNLDAKTHASLLDEFAAEI